MTDIVKYNQEDFELHIPNNINVYELNGDVVGFTLFYDHITWGYIEILCVDEQYRNMGIGKKLINSVNNDNWYLLEVCCHLSDINIIEYIKKCGFESSNQKTDWFSKKLKK